MLISSANLLLPSGEGGGGAAADGGEDAKVLVSRRLVKQTILKAINSKDCSSVVKMLEKYSDEYDCTSLHGREILVAACKTGQVSIVELILQSRLVAKVTARIINNVCDNFCSEYAVVRSKDKVTEIEIVKIRTLLAEHIKNLSPSEAAMQSLVEKTEVEKTEPAQSKRKACMPNIVSNPKSMKSHGEFVEAVVLPVEPSIRLEVLYDQSRDSHQDDSNWFLGVYIGPDRPELGLESGMRSFAFPLSSSSSCGNLVDLLDLLKMRDENKK